MPVYEYRCADCQKKFDVFTPQRMSLENVVCRHCHGANVTKLVSVFASVGGEGESDFSDYSASPESGAGGGGCCGGGCGGGCGCGN